MLKVKTSKDELTSFCCPGCGALDVVYIDQGSNCFICGHHYKFDVVSLVENQYARINHYFLAEIPINGKNNYVNS